MAKPDEIKAELRKRHDAGEATGEDRLNLDALELIERLQAALEKIQQSSESPPLNRSEMITVAKQALKQE